MTCGKCHKEFPKDIHLTIRKGKKIYKCECGAKYEMFFNARGYRRLENGQLISTRPKLKMNKKQRRKAKKELQNASV